MQILNQLDKRWRKVTIGNSKSTIGAFGCTITCLSMFSDYAECYKSPDWMAKNFTFVVDKVIWQSIKLCFKFVWRYYKYDEGIADDALKDLKKGVLFNIMNGKHWVLGMKKISTGYIVADPYGGLKNSITKKQIVGMTTLLIN